MIRFTATLLRPKPAAGAKPATWTFLMLPKAASKKLPARGPVSVQGNINAHAFQATLQPDGQGGHWLKMSQKLSKAAGAAAGETVSVQVTPMAEEPEPEVPADLRKALTATPKAKATWSDITPLARRDWIQWITSGKRAATRPLRIGKACDMLANGKRRPCCFDRSGMYDKSQSCPESADH
tara:strand:+ start:10546 stop:11088 length:543 start_codon:yes stop_codon:yes gene_type:complete